MFSTAIDALKRGKGGKEIFKKKEGDEESGAFELVPAVDGIYKEKIWWGVERRGAGGETNERCWVLLEGCERK